MRPGGEGSMLARVLTLRFDPALEAFDDGPLQEFLRSKEVHAISDHFFIRDGVPYLAVLVTYGLPPATMAAPQPEKAQGGEPAGSNRVYRGGGWINNARNSRASNRNNDEPGNRNDNLGFRLLSTRRCQRARFKDRARAPRPCPGGSSGSGEEPDEQQQPAASGRPEGATAAAGNTRLGRGRAGPRRPVSRRDRLV